jgi:hypothetical protein
VEFPPNYSEAAVPAYKLPPLSSRVEALEIFQENIYGKLSPVEFGFRAENLETVLVGGLERRQFRVKIGANGETRSFDLLLFLPRERSGAVPVFLGLNFYGNHTVQVDPEIIPPRSWLPEDRREIEAMLGCQASRWPVEEIVRAGFGVATVYCGDFAPDDAAQVRDGVLSFWSRSNDMASGGAIAAWAWGLSRALDFLTTLPEIDAKRVAVMGHSRLGKAALWAGAGDERFSLVISNNSGAGGAALARRRFGERIVHLAERFPYWFAPAFQQYREREEALPVDQHQLLALVAPRGLYVASAKGDLWADPRGEYLSLVAAAEAWDETLPGEMPAIGAAVRRGRVGYHVRSGVHDVTPWDWARFCEFARAVR